MNNRFNEDPIDPDMLDEEVRTWVNSAMQEMRISSIHKALRYNYDFSEDKPIVNQYSRLLWDINPVKSTDLPIRTSSSQVRMSSLSTAVADDFDLLDNNRPVIRGDFLPLRNSAPQAPRPSDPIRRRERLGSLTRGERLSYTFSRSKSY